MKAFENFLAHAAAKDEVWFATRKEIAEAYAAQVPAPV